MKIPHEKFCILPWISLEASPIGTVRPCCLALDEVVDDQGEKIRLGNTTFTDIQNSNDMRKLREQFLAGQKPQTCRRCWNEERSGRTSKRMHTLNRLKHIVTDETWTAEAKPLVFLDLKLGNICNLKCRICGSWSSSQFAAEELHYMSRDLQKDSYPYQMLREGAWPRESAQFWQEVDQHLLDIRYIEFTGGEPFMIQEHFDLLQKLVDRGLASRVEIHYNTNGTQYPENAEEIWRHFKHVEIAFSIDDVGARFEYQRSNAIWDDVVANIEKFRAMKARNTNITLQVCCTINVFNIYYLADVAQWISQGNFDFVYWNMMHDAYYFSISTLPESAKQIISEHLRQSTFPDAYRGEIDRAIDFMNNGNSTDGSILRMKVKDLDFKRQQNLRDVAPELAAAIEY